LSNLSISYIPIRYAYAKKSISTSSCGVAYGYSTTSEESFRGLSIGFKAPATQAILNNLPQWMEMRKNTSSNGWTLVNSWGQNLEYVVDLTKSVVQEQFLSTADTTQRSSLYSFSISDRELIENVNYNNILFNSNFARKGPSRMGMPAGWVRYNSSHRNTTYLVHDRSFICTGSMVVEGTGVFGQYINTNNVLIKNLTGSCYLLANNPNSRVGLVLVAETIDGIAVSSEAEFKGQSQQWQRLVTTLDINAKVFRVHFVLHANSPGYVIFNAPKLEESNTASMWSRSFRDSNVGFSQVCAISG
jgi:hypothetical protein